MAHFNITRIETPTQKPKCFSHTTEHLILSAAIAVIVGTGVFFAAYYTLKWPIHFMAFAATGVALGTLCVTYSAFRYLYLSPASIVENRVPGSNFQQKKEVLPSELQISTAKQKSLLENKNLELNNQKHRNAGQDEVLDCCVIAAYAVEFIGKNYTAVLNHLRNSETEQITKCHTEILRRGHDLAHSDQLNKLKYCIYPEQLAEHFPHFKALGITINGWIKTENVNYESLFSQFKGFLNKNSNQIEFYFVRINQDIFTIFKMVNQDAEGILFDSLAGRLQIVDAKAAALYVMDIIKHTKLQYGGIRFYAGSTSLDYFLVEPLLIKTLETTGGSKGFLRANQFLFGGGCTQYEYPVKNRADAFDCSILATYAILYLKSNYELVLEAVLCEKLDDIKDIQLEILKKGYELTHPNGNDSVLQNGIRIEEIHSNKHFGILKNLNLPNQAQEIILSKYLLAACQSYVQLKQRTTEIVGRFFDCTHQDSKVLHYLIATIDGQTITFVGIKGSQFAFLFDSHRNEFSVVDLQKAIDFIFGIKLNGITDMEEANFEFYPGFIKS